MIVAAAAVTQTPLSNEAAAVIGSLIITITGGLSGLVVWLNRKVTRQLSAGQARLAHAQAEKTTVEAVLLVLDQVQENAEEARKQARSADDRAILAERQVARLRKWAVEVDAIVRAHGITIPPLPDLDEGDGRGGIYLVGR